MIFASIKTDIFVKFFMIFSHLKNYFSEKHYTFFKSTLEHNLNVLMRLFIDSCIYAAMNNTSDFFSFIFYCLQNVCTMISFLSIILINKNIFLFFSLYLFIYLGLKWSTCPWNTSHQTYGVINEPPII